jgi:hypothetical protein
MLLKFLLGLLVAGSALQQQRAESEERQKKSKRDYELWEMAEEFEQE